MSNFLSHFKTRLKTDIFLSVTVAIYIAFCVGSGIYFCVIGQTRNAVMSFAFLALVPVFYLVEYILRLKIPALFAFLLLFLAAGCVLGSCYDLYTHIPVFDEILHGLSGVIFGVFGFALMKIFLKENTTKNFFICLFAGFVFSLAIAVLWEMFEYAAYFFLGIDMQEDTIINGFSSYLLAGSHNETVVVNGITQTVITFANGETLVLSGYLDIGLYDTLNDMLVCLVGAVVYFIVLIIDNRLGGRVGKILIPQTNAFERAVKHREE